MYAKKVYIGGMDRHPAETDITAEGLKLFRTEHSFSQTVMAQKMGVSLRTYQDLESGAAPIRRLHARALDGLIVMYPDAASTAPHVRLLQWRTHLGVSVKAVAKSAGVLPQVIENIEGARSGYTMRMMQRASRALGIPFETMIGQSPAASDAELMSVWDAVPPERRSAALRVLRALAVED
ncbi:hypothetical protein [Brevundimonas sp.]|uniref:hypothetical protein n=1 Tax=Brevundimonas sp. TaxID=1871086 RepID=UPI003568E3D7